ncbi:hypothetical protein I3760_08G121200 [Carya illinoinensis]|nr:hypothetical protein I3760_08G121200 [Carya illinoinensis]
MEDANFILNAALYNPIICSLFKDGLLTDAFKLFSTMMSKGIQPDLFTYNHLIQGLCTFGHWKEAAKLGKMTEAKEALDMMTEKGIEPNVFTHNSLIDCYCQQNKMDEAVKTLTRCKRIVEAINLFHEMLDKRMIPNVVTYTTLIGGFCRVGRTLAALELLHEMQASGEHLDLQTYAGLRDEAWELLEKMDGNGCLPDNFTYNTIIQELLQHNETSRAIEYIEIMVDKGYFVDVTTATLVADFLSAKKVGKTIQEWFEKLL